jgi:hypothetical protein
MSHRSPRISALEKRKFRLRCRFSVLYTDPDRDFKDFSVGIWGAPTMGLRAAQPVEILWIAKELSFLTFSKLSSTNICT